MTRSVFGIWSIFLTAFSSNQPNMQVPRPSSVACKQKCSAAIPISIKLNFFVLMDPPSCAVIFERFAIRATITGTFNANRFIEVKGNNVFLAISSLNSLLSTTTKYHGCELHADGASLAASRQRSILSRSTLVAK